MTKEFILTEVKFIIGTILLSVFGLTYFHLEFSKLENYKGLTDMLLKPYMYHFEGFVIIAWYLIIATCLFFIVNELYKFVKEKMFFTKKVIILKSSPKPIMNEKLTIA